jgi:hypothetical protein
MNHRKAAGSLRLALAFVAGCAGSEPIGGSGAAGSGGTAGPGAGGAGANTGTGGTMSDPTVPTFTWLYDNLFHGYCSDRNQPCHNPGANNGVSVSTRVNAYGSFQAFLVPGDYLASDLYYFISDGIMPPINPRVPADLQARLAAWIDSGAPNN